MASTTYDPIGPINTESEKDGLARRSESTSGRTGRHTHTERRWTWGFEQGEMCDLLDGVEG